MIDKEMLEAMQLLITSSVQPIHDKLDIMQLDVAELKTDVAGLKTDVKNLQSDMREVKRDVKKITWQVDTIYDFTDSLDLNLKSIANIIENAKAIR